MGCRVTVRAVAALALLAACRGTPAPELDREMLARIRDEGLNRSRVMELASHIADAYGPRLAGSPSYRRAAAWARQTFAELGLANAAVEPWGEYGMGWENSYTAIHLIAPEYQPIIGYPRTGSKSTDGPVRSEVVHLDPDSIRSEADLDRYRGRLRGRIVFTAPIRPLSPGFVADARRWTDRELDSLAREPATPEPSVMPPRLSPEQLRWGRMPPLTPYQRRLGSAATNGSRSSSARRASARWSTPAIGATRGRCTSTPSRIGRRRRPAIRRSTRSPSATECSPGARSRRW